MSDASACPHQHSTSQKRPSPDDTNLSEKINNKDDDLNAKKLKLSETTPELTAENDSIDLKATLKASAERQDKSTMETKEHGDPKKGGGGAQETTHIIKMLCPFWCAGAVIGTRGQGVKRLKETSGCEIKITQNFDNFPGTNERIISLRGSVPRLVDVIRTIQDTIRKDAPPNEKPRKRDNTARKACLKLVVPFTAVGVVIGKGGEKTRELEVAHGVVLDVMKTNEAPRGLRENVITIKGDQPDHVDSAMAAILHLILGRDGQAAMAWQVEYSKFMSSTPCPEDGRGGWWEERVHPYPPYYHHPPRMMPYTTPYYHSTYPPSTMPYNSGRGQDVRGRWPRRGR